MRHAVLASFGVVAILASRVRADDSVAGRWVGSIKAPGLSLAVNIDLAKAGDAWTGDISIPEQHAADLPLSDVAVVEARLTWKLPSVPGNASFAGTVSADGKTIDGTFTQGGVPLELDLTRAEVAANETLALLDGFDAWAESTREAWRVPGFSIAVVKDGEPLLVRGYGARDKERSLPVTDKTLFAIGSASKAFTTFVMATLVRDGKMEWDKPVRTWMPDFALREADVSARITPRDLVTHRSGLPRHDLLWYNSGASRAEVVERVRHLDFSRDFRTDWQYNNLMYISAGMLIERLTGSPWEDQVRARIFTPLGMSGATFAWSDAEKSGEAARGYEWRDDTVVRMPYRELPAAGPAGSIIASAADLVPWLAVHTGDGAWRGTTLLPRSEMINMHNPSMAMPPSGPETPEIVRVGYGLGWFVDMYRGHLRVHHGGNIDGFSALVCFIPEARLGVAVLANMNGSQLPNLAVQEVTDRFLQLERVDWSARDLARRDAIETTMKEGREREKTDAKRPGTEPSRALEEYAGEYEDPAYGVLTITTDGQSLAAAFNNMVTTLEHWHYDVFAGAKSSEGDHTFEAMRYSFVGGADGYIQCVEAIFEPAVKPIRFVRRAEAALLAPEYLASCAGEFEVVGQPFSIRPVEGGLEIVGLGGAVQKLTPIRRNVFAFKEASGVSVEFVRDATGAVTELKIVQPGAVIAAKPRHMN